MSLTSGVDDNCMLLCDYLLLFWMLYVSVPAPDAIPYILLFRLELELELRGMLAS